LAQHAKGPGLITLTAGILFFTPLVHSSGKLNIPLANIRGIKKTGAVKGMSIRWIDEEQQERVERFMWVRGRDEAFARLIGAGTRGWVRV
jgi:GRAM domain-containing protein 4